MSDQRGAQTPDDETLELLMALTLECSEPGLVDASELMALGQKRKMSAERLKIATAHIKRCLICQRTVEHARRTKEPTSRIGAAVGAAMALAAALAAVLLVHPGSDSPRAFQLVEARGTVARAMGGPSQAGDLWEIAPTSQLELVLAPVDEHAQGSVPALAVEVERAGGALLPVTQARIVLNTADDYPTYRVRVSGAELFSGAPDPVAVIFVLGKQRIRQPVHYSP